jgi:acetyl-CoA C-acetyltransferase
MLKNVYIVESLRTPFGSFNGLLSDVPAPMLASEVMKEILNKNSLNGSEIDEVILGQVIQAGVGQAPARQAMRFAGISDRAHAITINKVCGSGLKAIMLACQSILTEEAELVFAGGMENMSMAPHALFKVRKGIKMGDFSLTDLMIFDALKDPYSGRHMGEITEDINIKFNISRKEQDDYAVTSYKRSQNAIKESIFDKEIVKIVKKNKKGNILVDKDEEPFNGDINKIPLLRSVFKKDGTITAGNASTINDGAAVTLVASEKAVKKYGLQPKAKIIAYETNSIHPDDFGIAPIRAIEKILTKSGLTKDDIDFYEINEAFSSVVLIASKELGLDMNKINVNGGAVSLGHPVGASGGRLVSTLVRQLEVTGKKYGLAVLCIGGGEAVSIIIEKYRGMRNE